MRGSFMHANCSTYGGLYKMPRKLSVHPVAMAPTLRSPTSVTSVPTRLFESFSAHLLWILVILLFASDAGINQVQSENAPIALPIAGPPMKYGIGIGGLGGATPSSSPQHASSSSSNLLNNNNSSSGNFTDLGDSPFENNTFTSTTVPVGDSAFLKCNVKNLGNRTISWIRRRDMHIITVDRIVYTNDERFNILHVDGSDDWTLQIKFVQKRDNGSYECQVSSGKGISSFAVHVFVVVPEAFILGNGEYHIQQGSTINLVCIVEKSPRPPEYIFWYHNERMINYGSTRDLSIQTETGSKTQSRLIIENAQVTDSGNYSCITPGAEPAFTLVYISLGDKMAAIQRRKSDGSSGGSSVAASSAASSSSSANSSYSVRNGMIRAILLQLLLSTLSAFVSDLIGLAYIITVIIILILTATTNTSTNVINNTSSISMAYNIPLLIVSAILLHRRYRQHHHHHLRPHHQIPSTTVSSCTF